MKILYFAWLRQKIGLAEETVAAPDNVRTVADLIAWLESRGENYRAAFIDLGRVRAAVNHAHVPLTTAIAPGDEVAFFPPVTGGAP
ncbi:MAG: molybdopterin converting factor subunit 1 [Alphaproteobacteria bacterium]|nr:molybdopterin converting factor subunit 1 [Alphaproteobacteria bacterium]